MKTKDLPVFKQKILNMLPITQADMWKKLEIGSREGSYIVNVMLEEHLLTRTRKDGRFLLEKSNGNIDDLNKGTEDAKKPEDVEEKTIETKKKVTTKKAAKKKESAEIKKEADVEIKKEPELPAEVKKEITKKKESAEIKKEADVEIKKELELPAEVKKEIAKKKESAEIKKDLELPAEIAEIKKEVKLPAEVKKETVKKKESVEIKKELELPAEIKKDVKLHAEIKKGKVLEIKKKESAGIKKEVKLPAEIKKSEVLEVKKKESAEIKKGVDFTKSLYNIKPEDIIVLKQKVLDILPALQGDIGKRLDNCDCSYLELIDLMVQENLVTRTKQDSFFLIEAVKIKKADVSTLISGEYVQKMKPKDTNDLRKMILGSLPIEPSQLLEKLDVGNRILSGTINAMIKENLMTRTEEKGRFLLEKVHKSVEKRNTSYEATLSSKNRFAPCCGCALECDAATCILLTEWLIE